MERRRCSDGSDVIRRTSPRSVPRPAHPQHRESMLQRVPILRSVGAPPVAVLQPAKGSGFNHRFCECAHGCAKASNPRRMIAAILLRRSAKKSPYCMFSHPSGRAWSSCMICHWLWLKRWRSFATYSAGDASPISMLSGHSKSARLACWLMSRRSVIPCCSSQARGNRW